ncbi:MAG TPA: ABC transporter ATP-binding protein [Methanotrichaceae archaeon]|nr:ABC transporter ATP-binding protein [Methanotrichaceae archaeon]
MLRMHDVTAGYGAMEIVHALSLTVGDEEIVTIIGPNGSGKSTVMKTVLGLTDLKGGRVLFGDVEISGMRPDKAVRLGIGYVPQERNVFPSLTARENLEMGAFTRGCCIDDSIDEVLAIFPELKDKLDRRAGTMSGGEQKMLAISRALVIKPKLLLLDEPSSALSPKLADQVFSKIKEVNQSGTAIMMVEQNARKALAISDRGYILEMGRNRFEGPAGRLLDNADVRKLYLGG